MILVILVIIEAAIIYAVGNIGISGLAEVVFIAALPLIVILGFVITRIVRR